MSSGPNLRSFVIDGLETTERTFRTGIVEHFTPVAGKTFLDVGAADGYEARALAIAGADRTVAVEGKAGVFELARAAQEHLKLPNHEVMQCDARRIDEYGLGTFDVVLCFGFLYHVANPFNMLKRLRNVTGELLLLETHVAPRSFDGLMAKHVMYLPFDMHRVELDGIVFEGKIVRHVGDPATTKGSLDAPWTFWLTEEALLTALVRSGFAVLDYYHELDASAPEALRRYGTNDGVGVGVANTKVWIVAAPNGPTARVQEPVERVVEGPRGAGPLSRVRRRLFLSRAS